MVPTVALKIDACARLLPGDRVLKATVLAMPRKAASTPPAILKAIALFDEVHLSDRDIGRATDASPSTARAWLVRSRTPTAEHAERLIELAALVEQLARVRDPDYLAVWLRKPVPALDDETPLDVIGWGECFQVSRLVSAFEEPTAA